MPKVETYSPRGTPIAPQQNRVSKAIGIFNCNLQEIQIRPKRDLSGNLTVTPRRRVVKKLVRVQPVNHTLPTSNRVSKEISFNANQNAPYAPARRRRKRIKIKKKKRLLHPEPTADASKRRRKVVVTRKRLLPKSDVANVLEATQDNAADLEIAPTSSLVISEILYTRNDLDLSSENGGRLEAEGQFDSPTETGKDLEVGRGESDVTVGPTRLHLSVGDGSDEAYDGTERTAYSDEDYEESDEYETATTEDAAVKQNLPDYEPFFPELSDSLDAPLLLLKTTILTSTDYETKVSVESRNKTYTVLVTRVNGDEQIVTSTTEIKPITQTITVTEPVVKFTTLTLLDLDSKETLPYIPLSNTPENHTQEGRAFEEARYNLATRIMANGVEVIVAGDKTTLPGEPDIKRVLPSSIYKPVTLKPSTLSDHMMMMVPQDSSNIEILSSSLYPNQFVTKTCLTTFTYLTTYLENGTTTVSSHEQVVSNIATEERNTGKILPTPSMGITLTQYPNLSVGIFPTTYTYLNTILDGEQPLVVTSKHTVTNTVTAPDDYLSLLQPLDKAPAVKDTNTYYSTIALEKTLYEGEESKVVSANEIVTQVVITESVPPKATSVMTSYIALDVEDPEPNSPNEVTTKDVVKTYYVTYTYYNTILEDGNTVVQTNVSTSSDVVTEKLYLHNKRTKPSSPSKDAASTSPAKKKNKLASDFSIYATKTYLTTFTYLTTLLSESRDRTSTVVSSRSRIVENVVTETIEPSLLDKKYLSSLKKEIKDASTLTKVATIDGQKIEITVVAKEKIAPTKVLPIEKTAMPELVQAVGDVSATSPSVITGSTIIFFDEDDDPFKLAAVQATPSLNTKSTKVVKTTTKLNLNSLLSSEIVTSSKQSKNSKRHTGKETVAGSKPVATGSTAKPSLSSLKEKKPANKIGTSSNQVPDLLGLGSINIDRLQVLTPVLNVMADLLQNNLKMSRRNDTTTVKPAKKVEREKVVAKASEKPPPADTQNRSPIYIPVGGFTDIEVAESQNIAEFQINEQIPWEDPKHEQISIGKLTHESPLLNGGIPISPGEVITTNSDVIVGKPGRIGPRIPSIPLSKPNGGDEIPLGIKPPPVPHKSYPKRHHEHKPIPIRNEKPAHPILHAPNKDDYVGPPPPPKVQVRPPSVVRGEKHKINDYIPLLPPPQDGVVIDFNSYDSLAPNIRDDFRMPNGLDSVPSESYHVYQQNEGRPVVVLGTPINDFNIKPSVLNEPIVLPEVIERSTGQPLLVNIQPSQVAFVNIPHNRTTALIYGGSTEPHRNGQYFDDPSPYPEPEFSGIEGYSNGVPQFASVYNDGMQLNQNQKEVGGVIKVGTQPINVNPPPISMTVGDGFEIRPSRPTNSVNDVHLNAHLDNHDIKVDVPPISFGTMQKDNDYNAHIIKHEQDNFAFNGNFEKAVGSVHVVNPGQVSSFSQDQGVYNHGERPGQNENENYEANLSNNFIVNHGSVIKQPGSIETVDIHHDANRFTVASQHKENDHAGKYGTIRNPQNVNQFPNKPGISTIRFPDETPVQGGFIEHHSTNNHVSNGHTNGGFHPDLVQDNSFSTSGGNGGTNFNAQQILNNRFNAIAHGGGPHQTIRDDFSLQHTQNNRFSSGSAAPQNTRNNLNSQHGQNNHFSTGNAAVDFNPHKAQNDHFSTGNAGADFSAHKAQNGHFSTGTADGGGPHQNTRDDFSLQHTQNNRFSSGSAAPQNTRNNLNSQHGQNNQFLTGNAGVDFNPHKAQNSHFSTGNANGGGPHQNIRDDFSAQHIQNSGFSSSSAKGGDVHHSTRDDLKSQHGQNGHFSTGNAGVSHFSTGIANGGGPHENMRDDVSSQHTQDNRFSSGGPSSGEVHHTRDEFNSQHAQNNQNTRENFNSQHIQANHFPTGTPNGQEGPHLHGGSSNSHVDHDQNVRNDFNVHHATNGHFSTGNPNAAHHKNSYNAHHAHPTNGHVEFQNSGQLGPNSHQNIHNGFNPHHTQSRPLLIKDQAVNQRPTSGGANADHYQSTHDLLNRPATNVNVATSNSEPHATPNRPSGYDGRPPANTFRRPHPRPSVLRPKFPKRPYRPRPRPDAQIPEFMTPPDLPSVDTFAAKPIDLDGLHPAPQTKRPVHIPLTPLINQINEFYGGGSNDSLQSPNQFGHGDSYEFGDHSDDDAPNEDGEVIQESNAIPLRPGQIPADVLRIRNASTTQRPPSTDGVTRTVAENEIFHTPVVHRPRPFGMPIVRPENQQSNQIIHYESGFGYGSSKRPPLNQFLDKEHVHGVNTHPPKRPAATTPANKVLTTVPTRKTTTPARRRTSTEQVHKRPHQGDRHRPKVTSLPIDTHISTHRPTVKVDINVGTQTEEPFSNIYTKRPALPASTTNSLLSFENGDTVVSRPKTHRPTATTTRLPHLDLNIGEIPPANYAFDKNVTATATDMEIMKPPPIASVAAVKEPDANMRPPKIEVNSPGGGIYRVPGLNEKQPADLEMQASTSQPYVPKPSEDMVPPPAASEEVVGMSPPPPITTHRPAYKLKPSTNKPIFSLELDPPKTFAFDTSTTPTTSRPKRPFTRRPALHRTTTEFASSKQPTYHWQRPITPINFAVYKNRTASTNRPRPIESNTAHEVQFGIYAPKFEFNRPTSVHANTDQTDTSNKSNGDLVQSSTGPHANTIDLSEGFDSSNSMPTQQNLPPPNEVGTAVLTTEKTNERPADKSIPQRVATISQMEAVGRPPTNAEEATQTKEQIKPSPALKNKPTLEVIIGHPNLNQNAADSTQFKKDTSKDESSGTSVEIFGSMVTLQEKQQEPTRLLDSSPTLPAGGSRSVVKTAPTTEVAFTAPVHHSGNEIKIVDENTQEAKPNITSVLRKPIRTVISKIRPVRPISTKYITYTTTSTVTVTETTVIKTLGGPPSTFTTVVTKTEKVTMVDTITEVITLLKPTNIVEVITTTVSQYPPSLYPAGANYGNTYPGYTIGPTAVAPSQDTSAIDLLEDELIITETDVPAQNEVNPENESFLVVLTDKNKGGIIPIGDKDSQSRDEMLDDDQVNKILIGGISIGIPSLEASGDALQQDKCNPECRASKNELCQKIDGLMRCVCRPGFARMFPDHPCKPTYTYTLRINLDRYGKEKLRFVDDLAKQNSSAYMTLAARTHEGLDRMVMQSDLRDIYHGVAVSGFEPARTDDGVISNFNLQLSDNTEETRLMDVFRRYLRNNNYSLGGTEMYASREGLDGLEAEDFNECADPMYHDCSESAHCFNLRGTYTCSCKEGFADLSENILYPGRICSAELIGCETCHFHGTCYNRGETQVICECFQWYAGEYCHINLKVLLIALVTLGVILFTLLLICIILTCCRRRPKTSSVANGMSFLPQRVSHRGRRGTLDRRAMIQDTSSESGQSDNNTLPYVAKKPKKLKGALKKPSAAMHSDLENGNTLSLSDQKDRSLTVMIPRAKYHPAPPTSPHVTLTTFDKRKVSTASNNEAKLLCYLDAGPSPNKIDQRKYSNAHSESYIEEKPLSRKTSGALISAGFEVSATVVGNNMGTLGTIATTCGTEADRSENATLIQKISADLLSSSTGTRSQFNTLRNALADEDLIEDPMVNWTDTRITTVSEARSYDETTIQPPMKSFRNDYDSKPSSQHPNDETITMAERDLGSTFLLPHTHLYKPDRGSDISGFESL